ncbi:MAG: alpha/beta hydrolase [Lutisporaceae bacterium]
MLYTTIIILILILGLMIVALLFAGNYFYNFAILRRKKEFLSNNPDLKSETSGVKWQNSEEWLEQQSYQKLNIKSYDGLNLNAIYIPTSTTSNKIVILVHGYTSWNGSMTSFARYYHEELGYSVLMPDCRGHGKSEGNYIGFGWHDRKDMLQWIDVMLEKHGRDSLLVLHGISMGGATVLMTSGEALPANVKCIISDCAYNSIKGILSYQMKRMFRLPSFPLMQFTSLISRLRAGYSFKNASAVSQVKKCKIPILFIHGSADKFVPTEMVYELFEAASCEKQLLVVPDAAHGMSFWQDPTGYKSKVAEFLEKHI